MGHGKLAPVLFSIVVICILAVGYIYFFLISPTFVLKPMLEKPEFINEEVTVEHIEYLLNELDAYKLHSNPITKEEPIIKVVIMDTNSIYYLSVLDNEITTIKEVDNSDLLIKGNSKIILEILKSQSFGNKLLEYYNGGEIILEIIADEKILALKGYKSLYDKLSSNQITGEVINLDAKKFKEGINVSLLFLCSIIVGLIVEKL